MREKFNKYVNTNYKFDKLNFISILCLIVVISGIFGFVYEIIFYYFNSGMKQFYYRGSNFLPWINIYAIGALLIYLFTYNKRKSIIKVFLISTILCGVLEYIAGYCMYTFFDGFRCWNYNTEILNYGNIGGFICLRSILFFGLSSLLLIYGIIPLCYYLADKIPKRVFALLCISLFTIFIIDELYNLVIARILNTPRASDIYKRLGFSYMKFKK